MPTYDYECSNCHYLFEAFHGMNSKSLIDCPVCNTPALIKLISPGAAIIVRGTENPCNGGSHRKKTVKNDRLGEGKNKIEKPFWREGKVNKDILKKPDQYIKEGTID